MTHVDIANYLIITYRKPCIPSMSRTSIAVDQHTLKEARITSKTLALSLGKFVLHSAEYFRKTGIDPVRNLQILISQKWINTLSKKKKK